MLRDFNMKRFNMTKLLALLLPRPVSLFGRLNPADPFRMQFHYFV